MALDGKAGDLGENMGVGEDLEVDVTGESGGKKVLGR